MQTIDPKPPSETHINTICSFEVNPADVPPMLQQYLELKQQYIGELLLYQMGDFYETFFEDALIAAKALEITLTARDAGKLGKVPMAGVPIKSAQTYIERLLDKNFRLAICQQVEDPQAAKGLVQRKVTRVLSKGTATDSQYLSPSQSNYLVAVAPGKNNQYGLAWCEISTGQFYVSQAESLDSLLNELDRIQPSEILTPGQKIKGEIAYEYLPLIANEISSRYSCTSNENFQFDANLSEALIKKYFAIKTTESFGLNQLDLAKTAAGVIIQYLQHTFLNDDLPQFDGIHPKSTANFLRMSATTRNNLELLKTSRNKETQGSLFWVLDKTLCPMGTRRLKEVILSPSTDLSEIQNRLDTVELLISQPNDLHQPIRKLLPNISDLERLSIRLINQSIFPREFLTLKRALLALPELANTVLPYQNYSQFFAQLSNNPIEFIDIANLIDSAIADEAPMSLKEGRIFKQGFNTELDHLFDLIENQQQWLEAFEQREKEASGLKNLKVGFNNAFGFYIEISKAQASQAPVHYHRKQTLTNAERFITPELKEYETQVLDARNRVSQLEYELYSQLRKDLGPLGNQLLGLSREIGLLDVLQSFAHVANEFGYSKPTVNNGLNLKILQSRHPIIEKQLPLGQFVANDCELSADIHNHQIASIQVITGPNMAGKSTYMRQVALCVLMAQMGCYVPAAHAEIGICDQLFSRIGAVDDIGSGQSTFMVEMVETAEILRSATPKSFVILDEIGRGTSTFDGISIAWSIAEHLVSHNQSKTLFATHYHELNTLENLHPKIQNLRVLVDESQEGEIRFMYQVAPGAAQKSYGVHVAKMAGLPQSVVKKAEKILAKMQEKDLSVSDKKRQQHLKQMALDDQLQLF